MPFPPDANLTNVKMRRTGGDCYLRQYQVDPHWGIPPGQPPLIQDAITGLVRPASSYNTLATAVAGFVGFATDTFVPGEPHSVWVQIQGWVEMKLSAQQSVIAGDKFTLTTVLGVVSDDTVVEDPEGIFTAVQSCLCNPFSERISCVGEVPEASDTSPTATPGRQVQRTVLLSFGV